MKMILRLILLFSLTFLFTINVFAKNNLEIKKVELVESSTYAIEKYKPKVNGLDIDFNLEYSGLGDYSKYKVLIHNDTNKDYYVNNKKSFNESDYISYSYEYDNTIIRQNTDMEMFITIKYNKMVPSNKLHNNVYKEENLMSLDLSDQLVNPNTSYNYIYIVFIITILIALLFVINKYFNNKKINTIIIIGLLLLPITSYAIESFTIRAKTEITIDEKNILESRYINGDTSVERDFWEYYNKIRNVYFKNNMEEIDGYKYRYDVSERKNESIIAYLVPIGTNSSFFDLYLVSNGNIYANPDSSYVFDNFTVLRNINDIDLYKTDFVKDMSNMFNSTNILNSLDVSSFNTSNVLNMSGMFRYAGGSRASFSLVLGDNFDTSKVTNMSKMFEGACEGCSSFSINLGEKFNTSNVIDMSDMFHTTAIYATSFTLDLGDNFDTSKVTNMYQMFSSCGRDGLDYVLDLGDKFDTSNVENMSRMFNYTGWKNTSFTINFGDKFYSSKVTDMSQMFRAIGYRNNSFVLDLSNMDFSNVNTYNGIFDPIKTSTIVYVKDEFSRDWIINNSGNANLSANNVIIK